jgi:hypothetical protein
VYNQQLLYTNVYNSCWLYIKLLSLLHGLKGFKIEYYTFKLTTHVCNSYNKHCRLLPFISAETLLGVHIRLSYGQFLN